MKLTIVIHLQYYCERYLYLYIINKLFHEVYNSNDCRMPLDQILVRLYITDCFGFKSLEECRLSEINNDWFTERCLPHAEVDVQEPGNETPGISLYFNSFTPEIVINASNSVNKEYAFVNKVLTAEENDFIQLIDDKTINENTMVELIDRCRSILMEYGETYVSLPRYTLHDICKEVKKSFSLTDLTFDRDDLLGALELANIGKHTTDIPALYDMARQMIHTEESFQTFKYCFAKIISNENYMINDAVHIAGAMFCDPLVHPFYKKECANYIVEMNKKIHVDPYIFIKCLKYIRNSSNSIVLPPRWTEETIASKNMTEIM